MSAEALGGAVRLVLERIRLGEPLCASDVAALREQTRDVDRDVGALIRLAADEDRRS